MSPYPPPHEYRALLAWQDEKAREYARLLENRLEKGEVAYCEDASSAYRMVQRYDIEVALIASQLKGRTGGDILIAALKQDPELSSIKTVALLEGDEKQMVRKYEILQCDGVLAAPIDVHRFFEAMGRFLDIQYRRNRRLLMSLPVVVHRNGEMAEGRSLDLSISGVRFTAPIALQPGETIELLIHIDDERSIGPVSCEIKRIEGQDVYGAAFATMSKDDLLRLEYAFLEQERT